MLAKTVFRLRRGDGHGGDDVVHGAAAGEVVARLGDALQNGAVGLRARQALHQLVADVARFQTREHQHVGLAGHGAAGRLELADAFDDGRVQLQFAVQHQAGVELLGDAGGFLHLGDQVVLGRALGGEGEHGHARLDTRQRAGAICRAQSDAGQLLGVGVDVHGAVGKDHHAIVAIGLVRALHQEAGRHGLDAGLGLDDLQSRAQHVARGVDGAGNEAVRVAHLHHHHAVVHGILDQFRGLLGGHALGLAQLVERRGVLFALVRGPGVDDLKALQRRARRHFLDLCRIAQQRQGGDALRNDLHRGLYVAALLALGQHDVLDVGLRLCLDLVDKRHDSPSKCRLRQFFLPFFYYTV